MQARLANGAADGYASGVYLKGLLAEIKERVIAVYVATL